MEDSFLSSDSKCILVGNGPSVLEREIGEEIDKFDEIIRFNRFAIYGFEKNVGTKTTIWSTFGRGELPRDEDIRPEKIIFIYGDSGKPTYQPKQVIKIPLSFHNMLRNKLKEETTLTDRKDDLIPSSGVLVVSWLLENYLNKVTIVGFDNFSKDKSSLHHYWVNKSFTKPREHDGLWERQVIDKYESLGKITKL